MTAVAIYGRTYLDAELTVPLATLAEGKGKVDVHVTAVLGGFGCNAARVLGARLPAGAARLVTVIPRPDLSRLRAAIPSTVELDAIVDTRDDLAWPSISVIVNPASDCKLLRGVSDEDAGQWAIDRVAAAALTAPVQIVGRVPAAFVAALRARVPGARIAWCGGDALTPALETEIDLACINTSEAQRLLASDERSPRVLAEALAARARVGALRLVTGRANAPAVAAVREATTIRVFEATTPVAIAPAQIRTLKGVGDVFATRFLAATCLDELDVPAALADAQAAAHAFLTTGSWG